jgi:Ribonuclease HII
LFGGTSYGSGCGSSSSNSFRLATHGSSDATQRLKTVDSESTGKLAEVITGNGLYAYGYAAPKEIDQLNILNATLLAMERAVRDVLKNLPLKDTLVVVDGKTALEKLPCSQLPVPEGDNKSAAIAAASVIAKVRRDFLMQQLHKVYPDYGWEKNKGYPSRLHLRALGKVGPSPLHRLSFSWSG